MIFRGSITQRLISLSTLRRDGRPSPRKTRFRLLARLCRAGLDTRRVPMKGFTCDPPFPSFLAQGQIRFSVFQGVGSDPLHDGLLIRRV
jgi:hypothetical protein